MYWFGVRRAGPGMFKVVAENGLEKFLGAVTYSQQGSE